MPDLAIAANTLLAEQGKPALGEAEIAAMVGDGVPALVRRVLGARGVRTLVAEEAVARFMVIYEAGASRFSRVYPDVPMVLADIARTYRLAVCTNKPESATRIVLAGLDLARFFPVVLGGDSLPMRKPDPEFLLAALRQLGARPSESVMVGDHRNDVLAAQGAAMPVVFARYGYGAATLDGLAPDAFIDQFIELPETLPSLTFRAARS